MMSQSIYPAADTFVAQAAIKAEDYRRSYAASVSDPDAFWGKVAERLDWMRKPTVVRDVSFKLDDFHIRSEEHTSELQSLMRISYAVFCLKKKKSKKTQNKTDVTHETKHTRTELNVM